MNTRTTLPFVVLACCLFLLVGCKKSTAFLVVDSATGEPLPKTLVDHWMLYVSGDSIGDPYLDKTHQLDENAMITFKKPQKGATFRFRLPGYQDSTVRMTRPSEIADQLFIGGAQLKEWKRLEIIESEDDKVVTFKVPLTKS